MKSIIQNPFKKYIYIYIYIYLYIYVCVCACVCVCMNTNRMCKASNYWKMTHKRLYLSTPTFISLHLMEIKISAKENSSSYSQSSCWWSWEMENKKVEKRNTLSFPSLSITSAKKYTPTFCHYMLPQFAFCYSESIHYLKYPSIGNFKFAKNQRYTGTIRRFENMSNLI